MPVDEFGREIPSVGVGRHHGRRSPSPPHHHHGPSHHHSYNPHHHSRHHGHHSSPPPPHTSTPASLPPSVDERKNKLHPSLAYVDEPMVCEYVWKDSQQAAEGMAPADGAKDDSVNNENDNEDADSKEDNNNANGTNGATKETYDEYRKKYCLNYIRAFFNKHLDDSWFRQKFSPAVRQQVLKQEQARAIQEAQYISNTVGEKDKKESFLSAVRLGGGVKQQASSSHQQSSLSSPSKSSASQPPNAPPLQHLFSFQLQNHQPSALHIVEIPPYVTDEHLTLALVDQHNTALTAKQRALEAEAAKDPDNKDKKINDKAEKPTKPLKASDIKIYPAPSTLLTSGSPATIMHRDAIAIGPPAAFADIIASLKHRHAMEANLPKSDDPASSTPVTKRLVPRKGDDGGLDVGPFDLDVECSDPYGRLEYDADGRGGAPTDGMAVPTRKAIVGISPAFSAPGQNMNTNLANASLRHTRQAQQPHPFATATVVLSAALSSKERIEKDRDAAKTIAKALDNKKKIPPGCRLEDVLEKLFDGNESESPSDVLDASIAYLRRVHLVSFYNGCNEAQTIGDVLSGKHASSTVHLRLQNADDILQAAAAPKVVSSEPPTKEENENSEKIKEEGTSQDDSAEEKKQQPKDMLVQRLDDSIEKALNYCQKWLASDDDVPGMVDEETESNAHDIEKAEEVVKEKWMADHCILDDDGRARCSFRFCHKLFKDANFLNKHLLKKHVEFLRAEQAKCHDECMMAAWDACENRPVPPILVDCGSHFGCVSSNILPGREPDTTDPEPELWRKEEERRKREMEMRQKREELRQQYQQKQEARVSSSNEPRSANFVDVDDMKEEKVELTFDNVEVPVTADEITKKKKKKKRKLL